MDERLVQWIVATLQEDFGLKSWLGGMGLSVC